MLHRVWKKLYKMVHDQMENPYFIYVFRGM